MSKAITASIRSSSASFTVPAQAQWLGRSWEAHVLLIQQDLAMIRVLPQPVGTWRGFLRGARRPSTASVPGKPNRISPMNSPRR